MPPKRAGAHHEDEVLHCPLCISELDDTERAWAPCTCGYQLCLFCYDRIKSEFNGQCPGCRTPYDAEFQVNLVQRKEAAAHAHEVASPTHAAGGGGGAASSGSGSGPEAGPQHALPAAAAAGAAAGGAAAGGGGRAPPASPGRNLHIDEEQFWPSLASAASAPKAATPAAAGAGAAPSSRHGSPGDAAAPAPVTTRAGGGGGGGGAAGGWSGGREAGGGEARGPPDQLLQHEGSSSSSSATTATTPQSPACSVVAYRARTTSSVVEMLQGTCHVSLAPSVLAVPPLDTEGAALAASLQEAVRVGSVGVKQAAASIVSYLRQKQMGPAPGPAGAAAQQQAAAALVLPNGGLAAEAGCSGTPFGGGLFGGELVAPAPLAASSPRVPAGATLDSSPSLAVSEAPTFAQWGRADSMLSPMSSLASPHGGLGASSSLFEGWASSPQHSPTQRVQPAAQRLPLYARGAASARAPPPGFPGFEPPSTEQQLQQLQQQQQLRQPAASPPGFSRSLGYGQQQPRVPVQHL